MNTMKAIITLMWSALLASANSISQDDGEYRTVENILQVAGYPKPGDIPILNRKIFKGHRVSIREHPYAASIRRKLSHYLTAALLTRNLVITVAHPLHEVPITELNVVVGENYSDRGSMLLTVLLVIIHENFDHYTLKDDIALIRFYEDISYKGNVKPIGLTSPVARLNGDRAFVTGWGRCDNMGMELCLDRTSKYYPDETLDPMLRTVSFNMDIPNPYCDAYKQHEITFFPGMLCTGQARERDQVCPCLGVPGALLVVKARLTGLLSWGFGCGYSYDLPLVYTNIQHYSSWIAHNIKIIRVIKQNNLTALFHATKAYILSQWLTETRVYTPSMVIRCDNNFEPLNIDYEITKIRGSVYDVRDFIGGGEFHDEKLQVYENMRTDAQTLPVIEKPIVKTAPFIGNDTLEEIGFNRNDIFKVSNITESMANDLSVDADEDPREVPDNKK